MQRFTELKVWQRAHALVQEVYRRIAEGSITEVEYLFILSRDLRYLTAEITAPLIAEAQEISRMLYALRSKVEQAS